MASVADTPARRYDPAETRQRVLEAANNLFSTQGFSKTGTADIARAADVSEGSIFYHFGSKRSLLEELGRMYGERMIEAMRRDDSLDALEPGITIPRCFDYYAAQKSWEGNVAPSCEEGGKAAMHSDPDAEPFYRASREVVVGWVEQQYAAMAARRGIHKLNVPVAAALTYAAVGEALDQAFKGGDDESARKRIEEETVRFVRAACGIAHARD